MGPPSLRAIGNSFQGEQLGLTLEWDESKTSGIDIEQVSLTGGSLSGTVVDDSPGWFSFSNLLAGTYQLIVSGEVTSWGRHGSGSVGYYGLLATTRSEIAAPVSEPETHALLALGLAMVGWAAKRRKV